MNDLDKYKVIAKLGEGGMGKVYKVVNIDASTTYALKVAKIDSMEDSKNFIKEASVWFKFRRVPQVAEIFEIIRIDNYNVGIIIEYINGGNLRTFMATQDYSINEILLSLYDVSVAIDECNTILKDFSHNDIKPENCLRTFYGLTKLTDFGIAKASKEDIRTILTKRVNLNPSQSIVLERDKRKSICGTPLYMSPEHILGSNITSEKSDVYSLGIMALEILSGEHPLVGKDIYEILNAHIVGLPKKIRRWPSKLPGKIKRILDSAIEPNPSNRPSSMNLTNNTKLF